MLFLSYIVVTNEREKNMRKSKKGKLLVAIAVFVLLAALCTLTVWSTSAQRNNTLPAGDYINDQTNTTVEQTTCTTEVVETTTALTTKAAVSDTTVKATNTNVAKTSKPKTNVSAKQHKSTAVREKQIRNIYVTASGSKMSDEKVSYLMSIIEGLPNKFFTWNVKYIKVVDSIPGYGKNCRGMSVYAENTIYINSNISSNSMLRSSVYHEFGHYADASNTGFTLRDCYTRHDEWRNVSSAEMSRLYSYYPGMSSLSDDNKNMEAFAMVFDAYYTGCITGEKVDIKSLCPEMYNTVSNFCN